MTDQQIIDGRPSNSVNNSYDARLFSAEKATRQVIRRTEENRTEFNLRSGKSEAEVRLIIEDCTRCILLLKLTIQRDTKHRMAFLFSISGLY